MSVAVRSYSVLHFGQVASSGHAHRTRTYTPAHQWTSVLPATGCANRLLNPISINVDARGRN